MSLSNFETLFQQADQRTTPITVAAAGGADQTVLEALATATQRGWVRPVLTGNETEIRSLATRLGINLDQFTIVSAEQPAHAAVAEIRAGRAQALMKGQISTPELMSAVLARDTGLRSGRTIGQIVLMELPRDKRCFLLTDTGITIQPTLDQKRDLLRAMVDIAIQLRAPDAPADWSPRVAAMAASEKVSPAMPETEEAATLQRESAEGLLGNCAVQGPLSFDLAYANQAAEKKRLEGAVMGAADAMLFPNLLSANLTVKAIMYTADCRFGGVLCGTTAPVVFMSRADDTPTRLRSLAFTLATAFPSA